MCIGGFSAKVRRLSRFQSKKREKINLKALSSVFFHSSSKTSEYSTVQFQVSSVNDDYAFYNQLMCMWLSKHLLVNTMLCMKLSTSRFARLVHGSVK